MKKDIKLIVMDVDETFTDGYIGMIVKYLKFSILKMAVV